MKNVLVLGNGYHLAHDLKTSYGNFLEFVKIEGWNSYESTAEINEEFSTLCKKNSFIKYLIDYVGSLNTWVDFENELRNITYALKEFFETSPMDQHRQNELKIDTISEYTAMVMDDFRFIACAAKHDKRIVDPNYYDSKYGVHWAKIKTRLRNERDGLKRALVLYLNIMYQ